MPYRQTQNVVRRLAARQEAILAAACAMAVEGGMAAVQMAPVAERAGVAAGTVYRYFPSKTELVVALARGACRAGDGRAGRAPQALPQARSRRSQPRSPPLRSVASPDAGSSSRCSPSRSSRTSMPPALPIGRRLPRNLRKLIRAALAGGHLPDQEVALAAPALLGALIEGLIGPLAPAAGGDPAHRRAQVQTVTLLALRALGVVDARARGLVVQTSLPELD